MVGSRAPTGALQRTAMEPRPNPLWLIMQAFHYTRRVFDDALREHGISAAQLGILNRLAERPGLSGAEVARRTLTTPQAAQLQLATLERKGFITRKPDPGRVRLVRSYLTEKGRSTVDSCRADVARLEQQLLAVLDDQEREVLVDLLVRYVQPMLP